ncbi:DUF6575 domain-containing protein [Demequina aurantiaca]|uniref:DUF6575 domain-containing protein n=1 Tax=Demequina aurantiaca TaxID=676200 RepID=UPI00078132EA|nr:DUF6575 domain-containing protein [Demequina aurantiaca]
MIDKASKLLPYGPLVMHEVYFAHDGPKLFSMRAQGLPLYVLANCVDENDEGFDFLCLVLDQSRFEQLRSGAIAMRDAIVQSDPGTLWMLRDGDTFEQDLSRQVRVDEVPEWQLPRPGAALNLPTHTLKPLDELELRRKARSSMRHVIVVELNAEGQGASEFGARELGSILIETQGTADALAQEAFGIATTRGAIPSDVKAGVQLSFVGAQAASFAAILSANTQGAMFAPPGKLEAVIGDLLDLLEASQTPGHILEILGGHSPRVKGRFRDLLAALERGKTGLTLMSAPQDGGELAKSTVTRAQVERTLAEVEAAPTEEVGIEVRRGALVGSVVPSESFVLYDNTLGKTYKGKVSSEAKTKIDGQRVGSHNYVRARLIEEIPFAGEPGDIGNRYTLVEIEPFEDTGGRASVSK